MTTASTTNSKSPATVRKAPSARPYSILDIDEDDLAPAIADVGAAIEKDRQDALKRMYGIGLAIEEHYCRLREGHRGVNWPSRGERFFEQLGEALGREAWWLRNHFRLVRTYSPDEFGKLCQKPSMTATKLFQLAGIDGELREELAERVADEDLSVRELDAAIKATVGRSRAAGAGRPPKRPKKVNDALVHITTQADKHERISNTVWFGDDYDIVHEIIQLPLDKVNDKLIAKIDEAAQKCDSVAATATKNAERLRSTLPEIERRMAAQAKVNATVEQAEKDQQQQDEEVALAQHNKPNRAMPASLHKGHEIGRTARPI